MLPRTTEGDSNCGKSRSAAGVHRWLCAGCDACALRIGAASDRPTSGSGPKAVPVHAHTSGTAPMAQPQLNSKAKRGNSGLTRTSELIDEDAV